MSIEVEVEKTIRRILRDDKYRTESQIKETVTLVVEDFHDKYTKEMKNQVEEIEKLRESHNRLWDHMNKPPEPKFSWLRNFFSGLKDYFTFGRSK